MGKNACVKKVLSLMVAAVLLVGLLPVSASAIKPSGMEYEIHFNNATDVYLGNKQPVDGMAGEAVYLTYTVESVGEIVPPEGSTMGSSYQHGVVATDDNTQPFPYEDGGKFLYKMDYGLLDVGYTYFMKLFVNEEGEFEYVVGKSKDGESGYVNFTMEYGEGTDKYNAFGLWFGCGYVTAKFSHVMCYDENGNDLELRCNGGSVTTNKRMQYDTQVQHAYNVSTSRVTSVAISNAKRNTADVTYMEYTVKSADCRLYQTGLYSTTEPTETYPHNFGVLYHENFIDNLGNGSLLDPGASYIIRFERGEKAMETTVQKTKDGVTETYSFGNPAGTYNSRAAYFGLWFGEGPAYQATFELINLKCYDDKGNNLGVQCNQPGVDIVHFGDFEDYSSSAGVYIDRETGSLLALTDDQNAKLTVDGKTTDATYRIEAGVLTLVTDEGKQSFDFLFRRLTGENAVYDRLGTYYVTFVDGTDDPPAKQTVDAGTGYTVMKPADPTREDAAFECWVLSDGTEYNFDSVVTESLTLYAKWSDGIVYEAVGEADTLDWGPIVGVGLSVVLLAAAVVIILVMVRKKGGNENVAN